MAFRAVRSTVSVEVRNTVMPGVRARNFTRGSVWPRLGSKLSGRLRNAGPAAAAWAGNTPRTDVMRIETTSQHPAGTVIYRRSPSNAERSDPWSRPGPGRRIMPQRRRNLNRRRGRGASERRSRRRGSDRKSTRLNSSHLGISYAVFCLKKKTSQYSLYIVVITALALLGLPIGHAMLAGSVLYMLLAGQDRGQVDDQLLKDLKQN